jgi:hypothetical protein
VDQTQLSALTPGMLAQIVGDDDQSFAARMTTDLHDSPSR